MSRAVRDNLTLSEQVKTAAIQFAVLALSFPFFFEFAHFLRG